MSTLDPLSDFYLPGPAARDNDAERDAANLPLPRRTEATEEWDREQYDGEESDWEESDEAQAFKGDPDTGFVDDIESDFDDDFDADLDDDIRNSPVTVDERNSHTPADSQVRHQRPAAGMAEQNHAYLRGNLIVAAVFAMALVALGWYLLQPQTLPIKQVGIEGEFRELSRQELQRLVVEQLQGGFFSVDVDALRRALTANPWVREVQVQRVWPDTLKITVHEQVPIARWKDQGLVSSEGDYFEPHSTSVFTQLPQLNGPAGLQPQLAQRLQQLQIALKPLQMQVAELTLSQRRAWSFTTRGDLQVVLGRDDFDERLQRFIDLVPSSLGERLVNALYIDMRYTNGFAVRFDDDADKSGGESEQDAA